MERGQEAGSESPRGEPAVGRGAWRGRAGVRGLFVREQLDHQHGGAASGSSGAAQVHAEAV